MVATLPELMGNELMPGFATAELPFKTQKLSMYLLWHKRHHADPAHQWLRERFVEVATQMRERYTNS